MIETAIIPARGGSVGLPRKNILDLGGIPLIAWTVRAAINSGQFDRILVSTDDDSIADASLAAGAEVPFLRPAHLATSTAKTVEVAEHLLDEIDAKGHFAILQPTSPFRSAGHLKGAVAKYGEQDDSPLISASEGKPASWSFHCGKDGFLVPLDQERKVIGRRQDELPTVSPNGAIYLQSVSSLRKGVPFLGNKTRVFPMGPIDSIDIDNQEDYELALAIVKSGLREVPE